MVVGKNLGADSLQRWLVEQGYPTERVASAKGFRVLGGEAAVTAERIVIVGADAAGMSAAHQALRTAAARGRELAITVLDKGRHTSYSACGIPYWMAGDVDSGDDLVARTADEHRAAGIDLRMETPVTDVDLASRLVTTATGETLEFDQLVVASGASPVVPRLGAPRSTARRTTRSARCTRSTTAPRGWSGSRRRTRARTW